MPAHPKLPPIPDVRHEMMQHQSRLSIAVGWVGRVLATPGFFAALLLTHMLWIVFNLPAMPWRAWDPYPFTLLSTIASVEAPFITLLILMNQARNRRLAELREETQLQVALHIEREATMALRLLRELQTGHRLETEQDRELLERLQRDLNPEMLIEDLRRRLRREARGDVEGAQN